MALTIGPLNYLTIGLQCPREHQAEDGNDDTQVQEQIACCNDIVPPKDQKQDVIDNNQYDPDQWQKTFAVSEVI